MATAGSIPAIRQLAHKKDNSRCAECYDDSVHYASTQVGTFICTHCATVYRQLGFSYKSIERDRWTEEEANSILGNLAVAQDLERNLPAFYRRPKRSSTDADVIRNEFIKAKYQRKEFTDPKLQASYHKIGGGFYKEGYLMKRLRDSDKYLQRHFELQEKDNSLRYFVKDSKKDPKNSIPIDQLNVTLIGSLLENEHHNLMLISFPDKGKTRFMYVYHEDAAETICWYNAIRGCKYYRYQMSLLNSEDVHKIIISYDPICSGYLHKTGPLQTEAWQKRWCLLLRRFIYYFANAFDPLSKGEIWIGEEKDGFSVDNGMPENFKKKPIGHIFTLNTPDRQYVFAASTIEEARSWVDNINMIIGTPATPQDYLMSSTRSN